MTISRFEEIKAWQEARVLVNMVYRAIKKNQGFSADFHLVNQIQAAAVSSMSNIAEGFSRNSSKEFRHYLFISRASAAEVQSQIYVALDQGYISRTNFNKIYAQADKVSKMCAGFIKYLNSNLSPPQPANPGQPIEFTEPSQPYKNPPHSPNSSNSLNLLNPLNSFNSLNTISSDVELGENVKLANFINLYGCTIGDGTKIGAFVEIQKNAFVGKHCKIQSHSFICEGVTIEDEVFIGHGVIFINDIYPRATSRSGQLQNEEDWEVIPTRIKHGASIGSNATILGGITIGEHSIVGAGSVVTKDVPSRVIAAGNPAKIIRPLQPLAR